MLCTICIAAGCSNTKEAPAPPNDLEEQGIVLGQSQNHKSSYLISTDNQMSEEDLQTILTKTTDEIIREYYSDNLYWLDVSNLPEQAKENLTAGLRITYTLQSNIQKDTRPPTITAVDILPYNRSN